MTRPTRSGVRPRWAAVNQPYLGEAESVFGIILSLKAHCFSCGLFTINTMKARNHQTLEDFAAFANIPATTVRNMVLGRQNASGEWIRPELGTLVRLARALDVPLAVVLERLFADTGESVSTVPTVPIVGAVGAGPGQDEVSEAYIPIDSKRSLQGGYVAYRVRGESMCQGKKPICDGDVIVVNTQDKGQHGSIVVALLKDGSHVCKLLRSDKSGRFLVSANPTVANGSPPIITADMVKEIIGRVVEVRQFHEP